MSQLIMRVKQSIMTNIRTCKAITTGNISHAIEISVQPHPRKDKGVMDNDIEC